MAATRCDGCGHFIPAERLEALPDTRTCVRCSTARPRVGMAVFDCKTSPEIVVIPGDDTEALRLADRANRRAR
jgi:hypothetical protein